MISGSIREERLSTASSTSRSYTSADLPSMESSEPDSSPMEAICSTMLGKTLALFMATVRLVPVETSCWIFLVACR